MVLDLDTHRVQTSPVEAHPTAAEAFRARYGEALQRYALSLSSASADLLVAVPRKAPRLLELIDGAPELPSVPMALTVSDRALPFMPTTTLAGARIVLTDDTVIYGSTFAGALRTLEEHGAVVKPRVLGVSRDANPEIVARLSDVPLRMTEAQVHALIDLEIQAFGALAVPYDIDHPIISLDLGDFTAAACRSFKTSEPAAVESTRGWQAEHDVRVFTVPLPDAVSQRHSQQARQLGPRKLRVFFDARRQTVRIVGIYCLAVRNADLADPDLFVHAPAPLAAAWREALAVATAADWPDTARRRTLVGTAHYLASLEAAGLWLHGGSCVLSGHPGRLRSFDLHLLFGHELGDRLLPQLEAALHADAHAASAERPRAATGFTFDVEREAQAVLDSPLGATFSSALGEYLAFAHPDDPGDRSHALFNAQRRVYDECTRGQGTPDPERLLQSLVAFSAVPTLLSGFGPALSPDDFDRWCDRAIDGGSIVPYYQPAASAPDLWVRCIRAGERRNEKLKYWLHGLVSDALKRVVQRERQRDPNAPEATLSAFVAEKTTATVVACLEPEIRSELRRSLQSGRDEFGARAQLIDVKHDPYLFEWAVETGVIERQRRPGRAGRSDVVPSARFSELFPPSSNVLSRPLIVSTSAIVDSFIALEGHLRGPLREQAIIALSTCASEPEYLESLSTELDVWLTNRHFNAPGLATDVSRAHELSPRGLRDLDERLAKSATALHQSEAKRDAFKARVSVRDTLDQLFENEPALMPYDLGWQQHLRQRIDETEGASGDSDRYLVLAALLGRRVVAVVRAVLGELDLGPTSSEHTIARHVAKYNRLLEQARDEQMRLRPPGALDVNEFPLDDKPTALTRAARLLLDAEVTIDEVWTTYRYPAADGALTRETRDVAVLMWDLMGSSTGDPANVGEIIHQVNEQVQRILSERRGEGFHESQDDGGVAILPTVADAVEVFHGLRAVFEAQGCLFRGAIESTVDADKLQRNGLTGEYNGRPYQIAARTLTAFKDAGGMATPPEFVLADGHAAELAPPPGRSYLNLTRRASLALSIEQRGSGDPEGMTLFGTIKDFRPRVDSTLPTDVRCFVSRS